MYINGRHSSASLFAFYFLLSLPMRFFLPQCQVQGDIDSLTAQKPPLKPGWGISNVINPALSLSAYFI